MPRQARLLSDEAAWYHVMNRAAGAREDRPFEDPEVRDKLLELIRFYTKAYCCRLGGYTVMGNHYHLILFLEKFRELSQEELEERARRLYGERFRRRLRSAADWKRFGRRLFSLSELERNINGGFTPWYNVRQGRRGSFWADRYRSVWLEEAEAVQDGLLYVELNAVRAGQVERPEQWEASSAWCRMRGREEGLVALSEIFPEEDPERVFQSYRSRLLYRGGGPGREGQARIPQWIVEQEQERGFRPGVFGRSLRGFTDGVALGSRAWIEARLEQCRERGLYRRRRHPTSQLGGRFYTLREQRRLRTLSSDPEPSA